MKKRLMNNLGLKILAFLIAFLLWIMVVNVDDPVMDKTYTNIPVTVINEEVLTADSADPKTYQIVDESQSVSVVVSAKRSVLDKIRSEDILATADMKELSLNTQIPIDITINGYEGKVIKAFSTPGNLQVKLESEQGKKFPITPTTRGTVRDGYVLGEIQALPESVFIRGPESVVGKISKVTAEVDVSGLSKSTVLPSELALYDENNNELEQSLLANNLGTEGVSISVQLLHTKAVELELNTSGVTAAEGYSVAKIKYEPEKIQVSGDKEVLDELQSIWIPEEALKVEGVSEKTEKIVDIKPYIPDGVQLEDENASTVIVTITVEKDGTKSLEMALGSITINNLSEDLKLTYAASDNIEIKVRGSKDILDTLSTGSNVTASIDLKSAKSAGTYDIPVTVQIPSGCTLEQEIKVNVILEEK